MKIKKLSLFILIILFFSSFILQSQPPEKMSYQAVIRDVNNSLVVNQSVSIRISILQHLATGPVLFMETHSATTNSNGLATIEIGSGQSIFPFTLAQLDWENDDFFIKIEVDATGGQNYSISGIQQLLTVPYAFHSGSASHFDYNNLSNRPIGTHTGDLLYWDATDSTWHIVPVGSAGQVLTLNPNGVPQWYSTVFNQSVPPTIRTDTVFDITGRVAYVKATIIDPGTTGIIASGVCWSTTPFPSIGNNHTTDGTSVGSFVSTIIGLTSGTTFYARAYATNSVGTSYGDPIAFTTPTHCGTVTDYDGNDYNTIYIGAQCWMKENLKTTHYSNGANITKGQASTNSYYPYSGNKYYYVYDDVDSNKAIYGLLYSWAAVMNGAGSSSNNPSGIQGICPSGWHVPSNTEWCELENYIEPGIDVNCNSTGYRGSMAKKLAEPRLWTSYGGNSFAPGYWHTNTDGFNTSGFSAIPGGRYSMYYYSDGHSYNTANYENINTYAHWWSCTLDNNNNIFYRYMFNQNSGINLSSILNRGAGMGYYHYAHSVRCIKN